MVGSDVHGATRGTVEGGFVNLGNLTGGSYGEALAASADGSVIVGYDYLVGQLSEEAFRWTAESGMVGLGTLPGTFKSVAYGVSSDGSVIVGDSHFEAFRWTAQEGMVGLGFLPGGQQSAAMDVSADGRIIVGDAGFLDPGITAFRWTAKGGMRDLQRIFTKIYGLNLGGWRSFRVKAVSADGNTYVGHRQNSYGYQEGWRVRIDPNIPAAGHVPVKATTATEITWTPSVFDPEDDVLTCRLEQAPANGVVSLASDCSRGTYQSNPGFIGTDTFTYLANDGVSDSNPGTVTVAVTEGPVDQICVQNNPVTQFSQTGKEGTLTITFTGNITSHTNKVLKVCPGTALSYATTSTQGPVVCQVKNNTTRGSGNLKINDHLKCTDKPAGKDKVHFKVKSGVVN
jgi:probable HAF family extracellular repeat protein